jgi:hypothetical protein
MTCTAMIWSSLSRNPCIRQRYSAPQEVLCGQPTTRWLLINFKVSGQYIIERCIDHREDVPVDNVIGCRDLTYEEVVVFDVHEP